MKQKVTFQKLAAVSSKSDGLTNDEVRLQRLRYGWNEIIEVEGSPWADLARETIKDPMLWLLLGVGGVFVLVGDIGEAVTLFIAILPLTFMDAFLHRRTQASTSALRSRLASKARVVREGKEQHINAIELVPGDIVNVASGESVPADGVFEKANALQVDESILTGEAFPVVKQAAGLDVFSLSKTEEIAMDDRALGFAGTRVLTGEGRIRILSTGKETLYGEIVLSASSAKQERTPLQQSIAKLVGVLVFVSVGFCFLLAGVRIYQGKGWLDALLSAATLAVAAIPEEFPVVFSFFLGVGVFRLAKRHALVRRAVSVENIGRVTRICTDKTGTITFGELKLTHFDTRAEAKEPELLLSALAASDPLGSDPIDQAIHNAAASSKLRCPERRKVFPFTESRKREVVFAEDENRRVACFMKGAPETVLAMSELSDFEKSQWLSKTSRWAKEGHKVLACAERELTSKEIDRALEPESGFRFLGLLAFEDPARPEVKSAVRYCAESGIGILMLTGDHPETATAIAKDVGIGGYSPKILSAEDRPEILTEHALHSDPSFLLELDGIARCTPLQKLRVVEALKRAGELVAVTGDGVNDVPALKAADIGIAMGKRSARSAKEVSSIILTDDNFSTLVNAIMEGRQLYRNLRTSFEYLILIHIPLVLSAAVIPLLGFPILYLPVHMVWLELIIHPTALFAFQAPAVSKAEETDANLESRKGGWFFSRGDVSWLMFSGLTISGALMFSYLSGVRENGEVEHARAIALAMLSLWSAAIVLEKTGLKRRSSQIIFAATLLVAAILIQVPSFAATLHLAPLHGWDWLRVVATVSVLAGIPRLLRFSRRFVHLNVLFKFRS